MIRNEIQVQTWTRTRKRTSPETTMTRQSLEERAVSNTQVITSLSTKMVRSPRCRTSLAANCQKGTSRSELLDQRMFQSQESSEHSPPPFLCQWRGFTVPDQKTRGGHARPRTRGSTGLNGEHESGGRRGSYQCRYTYNIYSKSSQILWDSGATGLTSRCRLQC